MRRIRLIEGLGVSDGAAFFGTVLPATVFLAMLGRDDEIDCAVLVAGSKLKRGRFTGWSTML